MADEIPQYCLRAYALFFSKHGSREPFRQSELDWIVSQSMKKKIFSHLLRSGWIRKESRNTYACVEPEKALRGLLDFKVPEIIKQAERDYCLTGLSALEVWSDYSYVQRGFEKSPYFMRVLKNDLKYWKSFFNTRNIPNYIKKGSTIGEYIVLMPVETLSFVEKEGYKVEPLQAAMQLARQNDMCAYAYKYMRDKYGSAAA